MAGGGTRCPTLAQRRRPSMKSSDPRTFAMTQAPHRSRANRWLSTPIAIALIAASMLIPAASRRRRADRHGPRVESSTPSARSAIRRRRHRPALPPSPPGLGQPPPARPDPPRDGPWRDLRRRPGHRRIRTSRISAVSMRPSDASQAAAVAAAAYGVLDGLTPATNTVREGEPASTCTRSPWRRSRPATRKAAGITVGAAGRGWRCSRRARATAASGRTPSLMGTSRANGDR